MKDVDCTFKVCHFLLISSVLTWAKTKQLDPDNPEAPLTEFDFKKRIPHENFKCHAKCETNVIMNKKNLHKKFKTLVLCTGITYGNEENLIHFLFKIAWQCREYLPIFGDGNNKIPLIHVEELSK